MRTVRLKIYSFEELSPEAQQTAIKNNSDINVNFDWWADTYQDAENIGLKLTSFDLDRNKHAKGEFLMHAYSCANKIIAEHGEHCQTYKLAKEYLDFYKEALKLHSDGKDLNFIREGEESYFYDYIEDNSDKFLKDILNCYADILQSESEYLQSEEAIKETFTANDYEFLKDGTNFNL